MTPRDRIRSVWEIPARRWPVQGSRKVTYRTAVADIYQVSRFWIDLAGIVAGVLIAVGLQLSVGWWISALVVPEFIHTIYELRCGHRHLSAGLLIHGTVIGLIGLLLSLPAYSGTSLIFMIVASVVLLSPRAFVVVIGYQVLWALAAAVLHISTGHPGWTEVQEITLSAIVVIFFSSSTLILLWVVMQELDLLDTIRGRLLGTVSHELRTPLTGVIGLGEILRDDWRSLEAATIDEFLSMITMQGAEASAIVEDLLTVVRSSSGSVDLFMADVPVVEQARAVVTSLAVKLGRSVEITGEETLMARADPARLRQILRNLLTNAARYGGDRIEIRLGSNAGLASIVVADDGDGIAVDEWEAVFESYRRATGVRRNPDSVGLGLPISRTLARLMEGDLIYRRDAEWSIFELTLQPITEPHPDKVGHGRQGQPG